MVLNLSKYGYGRARLIPEIQSPPVGFVRRRHEQVPMTVPGMVPITARARDGAFRTQLNTAPFPF